MDPIYLLILRNWAQKYASPTREHVLAIVERLDVQLGEVALRADRAVRAALAADSVALHAVHLLTGLPDDAADEEVAGAVEAAFAANEAQAATLRGVRDALGGAEGDLVEIAKEAMRQNGELLQDREQWRDLAQDSADAAAARDLFDGQLTQIRGALPDGVASEDLAEDVRGLVCAHAEARRLLGVSRDAHAQAVREANEGLDRLRGLVPDAGDRTLFEAIRDMAAERDELRAKATLAASIVVEDLAPVVPAPVQTSAPASPPAPRESGEGTMAMVDERIRAEEADRGARVGALVDAVGEMPEAIARNARVQVGPLSEALLSLANGEPGTVRQHAGRILNEHSNAAVCVALANWLNAHFRNLAGLVKPEDQREYRARFTAAIAAAKRGKAKVAA